MSAHQASPTGTADPVRWLLSGRVQGVGFRAFTRRTARELGLAGTVRNLDDGRVEVCAAADPDTLERFRARLRQGPPAGRVSGIEEGPAPSADLPRPFAVVF